MTYRVELHYWQTLKPNDQYPNGVTRETTIQVGNKTEDQNKAKKVAVALSKKYPDSVVSVTLSYDRWSKPQTNYYLNGELQSSKPAITSNRKLPVSHMFLSNETLQWRDGHYQVTHISNEEGLATSGESRSYWNTIFRVQLEDGSYKYHMAGKWATEEQVNQQIAYRQRELDAKKQWIIPDGLTLPHSWALETKTFQANSLQGVIRHLGSVVSVYNAVIDCSEVDIKYSKALFNAVAKIREAIMELNEADK